MSVTTINASRQRGTCGAVHPQDEGRGRRLCEAPARLYTCGWRCGDHRPSATRTAPASDRAWPAEPQQQPEAEAAATQGGLFELTPPVTPPAKKATGRKAARSVNDPKPTSQQAAIIDTFRAGEALVIEAGAGAGKTSTLKMCANADKRRGAYIVFGKANAAEAKRKFPPNVTTKTAHGFAHAAVGHRYQHRLINPHRIPAWQTAQILGINEPLNLGSDVPFISPKHVARIAMDTVRRFTRSADHDIGHQHVPKVARIDKPAAHRALAAAVEPYAAKAWSDLCSLDGKLRFEHDHYLKIWAMTEPQFDVDYVLLDEAQDADPSIAAVVNCQRNAQRIMVGDECQSIFAWRGAVNAMAGFAGIRLPLSQSFRFGPAIADEANLWLSALNSRLRLTGYDQITSRLEPLNAPDAVLCRTNGHTITEVSRAIDDGRKVALAGGGNSIRLMAQAALDLQAGQGTDHPDLFAFRTWEEVKAYVDQEDDGADLRTFVNLVESIGADHIIGIVDSLTDERRANVVVSTAHKAKGREWKTVRIADDFPEPKPHDKDKPAELSPSAAMLAYVAVTRAQVVLDRSGLAWIDKWAARG